MLKALTDLYGKKIALLLWFLDENQETSAVIVRGTAYFQDGSLHLHRGATLPPLAIPLKLVWRAQPVPNDYHEILGDVAYCIQGTPADLDADLRGSTPLPRSA
jgi:hypothetical protein